jgi:hypothetical protein
MEKYWRRGMEEDFSTTGQVQKEIIREDLYLLHWYMEEIIVNEWRKISRILDRYLDLIIGEE